MGYLSAGSVEAASPEILQPQSWILPALTEAGDQSPGRWQGCSLTNMKARRETTGSLSSEIM